MIPDGGVKAEDWECVFNGLSPIAEPPVVMATAICKQHKCHGKESSPALLLIISEHWANHFSAGSEIKRLLGGRHTRHAHATLTLSSLLAHLYLGALALNLSLNHYF